MRVALITGGTRGIGAASAEAFLAAGYRVAVSYRSAHTEAEAFTARTGIPSFQWTLPTRTNAPPR